MPANDRAVLDTDRTPTPTTPDERRRPLLSADTDDEELDTVIDKTPEPRDYRGDRWPRAWFSPPAFVGRLRTPRTTDDEAAPLNLYDASATTGDAEYDSLLPALRHGEPGPEPQVSPRPVLRIMPTPAPAPLRVEPQIVTWTRWRTPIPALPAQAWGSQGFSAAVLATVFALGTATGAVSILVLSALF